MNDSDADTPFEAKWFRLGVVLAVLYAVFTLALVLLFTVSPRLALIVAAVGGTLGAIALMIFVLYVY